MDKRGALLIAVLLGSCTMTAGPPSAPSPALQAQYARLLEGRVPGRPVSCLATFPSQQTDMISPDTLAVRQGSMVYLSQVRGNCSAAATPGYAMVFRNVAMNGPCQNDIVEVKDLGAGMTVGSCVLGPFVPYNIAR